ncbi:Endocytosis and vacuole integrity protein [Exophiala xenobiotica]|uniref:Endocytosis and vacuole integrity protein n=1 Tax=Lithohypha guttulata TaxID=1690604 RepID=A0ABR0K893_9EURO|nr:Endocytosis and vacuole integrity protein [Lithohypha guttulata]KAK5317221.1 Endocytosis and vacuole integrity protein [Exophiala xenobiotica]
MTAAFLQSELTSLISDSKRKYADVKAAAEKALSELRSISVTSETQLAGDLVRKPHFVDPFVLACKSQNVKLASIGAASLQRVVASSAIPRSRLPDVLQAFEEAVPLGLDVQLKVLQTLPSLLQLYAGDLHGETLSRTLSLVSAVFTRAIAREDSNNRNGSQDQDSTRDNEDALAVFIDLCSLLTEDKPQFVRLENLPPPSVLETLEGLLSAHGSFVLNDDDALKACSNCLIPGLSALIESSANFGVVVRALRIAFVLGSHHLVQIKSAFGDLFKMVLRISDRAGSHKWKRLLGLEFFHGFCSDFDALRLAFATFDVEQNEANIVSDFMASLVRTASEDPSLIGLGRQSTIPTTKPAEGDADVTGATDVPTGNVAQAGNTSTGVSKELSTVPTPCLDLYDRTSPPEVPETYVYTLVLGCISSFSDGLSKFIMPLSVPNRKSSRIEELGTEAADDQEGLQRRPSLRDSSATRKYQHLLNPLRRKDIGRHKAVQDCAKLIESCWPAVLATCSTFLNSALDSYFYHMLIRTVQKLTQVSGILELNTPRDALLTTLAKVAVPANVSNLMNMYYGGKPALQSDVGMLRESEEVSVKSPVASTPRQSVDLSSQTLNVRNLLCLRALLNLGIALGPTLSHAAWTIIMQSLEQVDALMNVGPNARIARAASSGPDSGEGGSLSTLASEIAAVDTARRRMVESTRTYPERAFKLVCEALFQMIEDAIPVQASDELQIKPEGDLRPSVQTHKSTRSVSGTWAKAAVLDIEVQFVLKTVGRLAHVNLYRFREQDACSVSWDLIIAKLLLLQGNGKLQPHLRVQSANIIDAVVVEACATSTDDDDEEIVEANRSAIVLKYGIPALGKQLESARDILANGHKISDVDVKIVQSMLEALHNLLGSRGEDLGEGWIGVFMILDMAVSELFSNSTGSAHETLRSPAFKVTQLVVSDFLTVLDNRSIAAMLRLFDTFGGQQHDLNMSLTTIALYWNLAALITGKADLLAPVVPRRSSDVEASASRAYSASDLWQMMMHSLVELSRDARPDSRNAAARMLTKAMEASIPLMTSQTFNSCFTHVLLPLLDLYAAGCAEDDDAWQLSAFNLLQDLGKMIQNHGSLLLGHSVFDDTWFRLIRSVSGLVNIGDVGMTAAALNALSDIINNLRQLDDADKFRSSADMLVALWSFWKDFRPEGHGFDGPNQKALASHARLWLEMVTWNANTLASIEKATEITAQVIKTSCFAARHEQYTMDVNRVSLHQEQLLEVMQNLRKLPGTGKRFYAQLLLDVAGGMLARTLGSSQQSKQSSSDARGARQPTGIAFATACIEELRKVIQQEAHDENIWQDVPIPETLKLSADLVTTKYRRLPTNDKDPLWQKACLLGVDAATVIGEHHQSRGAEHGAVGRPIYDLLAAILEARDLENMALENRPSNDNIAVDEAFDMVQLQRLHTATKPMLHSVAIPPPIKKQCILMLFNHSLVARPWYNDLTPDLEHEPLKELTSIRRGSIRSPDLPARRRIYEEALRCLFDHVSQTPERGGHTSHSMTPLAAPYILLRLSHTLKTFIADQPLRYLEHPHMALQEELHFVLRTFLDLRVIDDAFAPAARYLERGEQLKETGDQRIPSAVIQGGGKSHLRIMWGLVMRFEELWNQLPRLKKGHAWQDHEHGRGIEKCLNEWKEAVSENWGPRFR